MGKYFDENCQRPNNFWQKDYIFYFKNKKKWVYLYLFGVTFFILEQKIILNYSGSILVEFWLESVIFLLISSSLDPW